eukprot:5635603-Amphidinium_carterae.1
MIPEVGQNVVAVACDASIADCLGRSWLSPSQGGLRNLWGTSIGSKYLSQIPVSCQGTSIQGSQKPETKEENQKRASTDFYIENSL